MTKNEKITAGIIGGLALVLAVGAFEYGSNTNHVEAPTVPLSGAQPGPTTPPPTANSTSVLPPSASPVVPPRQWQSVAPGTPVGQSSATVVPSQTASGQTTLVRTPSGALVPSTSLRAEQPMLAPQNQTTVSRTETVVPAPVSNSTVTTTHTTAYVPENTTEVHRVYVHRRIRYRHRSSGKVHVARAIKHTVMFTAKLPGRLRL